MPLWTPSTYQAIASNVKQVGNNALAALGAVTLSQKRTREGFFDDSIWSGRVFKRQHLIGQRVSGAVSQTKMKSKTLKKKWVKKDKVATVKQVKRMLSNNLEVRQMSLAPAATMSANTVYSFNVTAQILQGTTDQSRIGDEINLSSLRGCATFITGLDAAFYKFRFLILYSGEEYNPSTTQFQATGVQGANLFILGAAGWTTAVTNPKACTILYDQYIGINSQIDLTEDGHMVPFNVSLKNRKFKYQAAGSVYGKLNSLYMVVIAEGSSSASAPVGNVTVNYALKYTDN